MEHRDNVAVIIVNFNSGPLLKECLHHLHTQTYHPARIIVVDNASDDNSIDGLEHEYPEVDVMRLNQNLGFAVANNLAVKQVDQVDGIEWIALLNPDAFPAPDWLEQLLLAAHLYPDCAGFGSRLLNARNLNQLDGTGDIYHVSGLAWRRDHGCPVRSGMITGGDIFSPCAAAALYRRAAFSEVGGFDESYFCYFEDVDLGFRLQLLGYRCRYVPNATIHHIGSAITGRHSLFSLYHSHRNLVWTFCKNMPGPLFWLYLPQHILLNLATVLWFGLHGQGQILLQAKWDAIRGLPNCWQQRRIIQAQRRIGLLPLWRMMSRGLTIFTRRSND